VSYKLPGDKSRALLERGLPQLRKGLRYPAARRHF
jgi:hypothetical protein